MHAIIAQCVLICTILLSCGGRAANEGEGRDPDSEGGSGGAGSSGGGAGSGGDAAGGDAAGGDVAGGDAAGGDAAGGVGSGGDAAGGDSGAGGTGEDPIAPENVGHVERSCGANMWSLDEQTFLDCRVGGEHEFHPDCVIVDCTEHGDVDAICVFSNHCLCSDDFACEGEEEIVGGECASRFSCVPVE